MAVTGRRRALTTKGERAPITSLAVPPLVATAMGLDAGAGSSIVPGELNAFDWVGHDPRAIGRSQSFLFGRCPPGLFVSALDACLATMALPRN